MTPATKRQQTGNAEIHQTDTKPAVFRCPKCGQTVATIPTAEAWCLPCGARMQPVKGKARP